MAAFRVLMVFVGSLLQNPSCSVILWFSYAEVLHLLVCVAESTELALHIISLGVVEFKPWQIMASHDHIVGISTHFFLGFWKNVDIFSS